MIMLQRLPVLLLGLCLAASLYAGTTNILPMKPQVGQALTVEFKADPVDTWLTDGGYVHAVLYLFREEDEAPFAVEVPMKKSGDRWEGTYTVPQNTVFIMTKVGNGKRYDTNKDLFTTVLVCAENGKPVRGANFRAGMAAFGRLPENCRRKEDRTEAIELFQDEIKLHPRNIAARINLCFVQTSLGSMTQEEATGTFREITSNVKQASSPLEAVALSQAFRALKDVVAAEAIDRDAAQRFPNSIVAEQVSLEALNGSPSAEAFVNRCAEHLERYPKSFLRDNIINSVVNASQSANQLVLLVPFLQRVPNLPANAYFEAVNYMGAVDSLRTKALEFIDMGIVAATTKKDEVRPVYAGPTEWNESQRIQHSKLLFVKAAILNAQNKKDEAITAVERSLEIGGTDSEKNAYDLYVMVLKTMGNNAKTQAAAERAITSGVSTQNIVSAYREMGKAAGKDSLTIEKDLAALKKKSSASTAARLNKEMLNLSAIDGELTTMDSTKVKLADLKGKVVFLDYWATWCGPCKMSFPGLQRLYDKYRSDPRVVIMAVNVWERDKDRRKHVADFLRQNPSLKFPVYFDLNDSVVGKFGVTGIPTKFILDKEGRIQFKDVGLTPEEQFLEEASMKIDMLLAE